MCGPSCNGRNTWKLGQSDGIGVARPCFLSRQRDHSLQTHGTTAATTTLLQSPTANVHGAGLSIRFSDGSKVVTTFLLVTVGPDPVAPASLAAVTSSAAWTAASSEWKYSRDHRGREQPTSATTEAATACSARRPCSDSASAIAKLSSPRWAWTICRHRAPHRLRAGAGPHPGHGEVCRQAVVSEMLLRPPPIAFEPTSTTRAYNRRLIKGTSHGFCYPRG